MQSKLFKAKVKNVRISPRKARLVADLVRGRPVIAAESVLEVLNKKVSSVLLKLIKSARSNAVLVGGMDPDELFIDSIMVGEGVTYKRYMPRAQGRATPIRKRQSHIFVTLKERT